jgi:hypothetical protein
MEQGITVWQRSLICGAVGMVGGVLVLHPAAMFITDYYGPTPHLHWEALYTAFSRDHLPMTIFYGILGACIGVLYGFLNTKLTKSQKRIGLLEGILPICCVCKKIRDEQADDAHPAKWVEVADYISLYSAAEFSHVYCPACGRQAREKIHEFMNGKRRAGKKAAEQIHQKGKPLNIQNRPI